VAVAAAALVRVRQGLADGRARPSEADRDLAALGARLAAAEPATSAALADEVARQVGWAPAAARARFLRRDRIAHELTSGAVVGVDSWMLARSEAAVAAYLHRAGRHGAR